MRRADAEPGRDRRAGFALLMSLVAIVGLTALATGGFLLAKSERRASSNHHAAVEAFYLADAGLNEYLAGQRGAPPDGSTSHGPYVYPGGTATVTVTRVGTAGAAGDPGLFLVESRGRYDPNGTGRPVTRALRSLALLDLSVVPRLPGAVTSAAGLRTSGDGGRIDGGDGCGVEPPVAGIRVPVDGHAGSDEGVTGDPPVAEVPDPLDLDGDGSTEDEARWWRDVLDATAVRHDHVVDDGAGPWPDTGGEDMPVTYVDRDAHHLGSEVSGRGLLVVRGDATLGEGFDWDGIVLVGGSLTARGGGRVAGAVVTGLNGLLGADVDRDELDVAAAGDPASDDTRELIFDSCHVEQVRRATAVLAELPGTWHERI